MRYSAAAPVGSAPGTARGPESAPWTDSRARCGQLLRRPRRVRTDAAVRASGPRQSRRSALVRPRTCRAARPLPLTPRTNTPSPRPMAPMRRPTQAPGRPRTSHVQMTFGDTHAVGNFTSAIGGSLARREADSDHGCETRCGTAAAPEQPKGVPEMTQAQRTQTGANASVPAAVAGLVMVAALAGRSSCTASRH